MSTDHRFTNALINEKSPYLLQHAHNPVNWMAWGPDALAKAKEENKPILVSIGYATCHWCHVMERESFENESVAEFMNEHFVCIKVDREERPDVDKVYMDAIHAMGEQGGWPLNVFLTPEAKPFYGGTYWPPNDQYGRPGFIRVLGAVFETFDQRRDQVDRQVGELMQHLQAKTRGDASTLKSWSFGPEELDAQLHRQAFDKHQGGFLFHHNNKFPPSMGLLSLLRMFQRTGEGDLLEMVAVTMERMRNGGIYDQVGGGLCRYSTDHDWLVPHFEKMLYDNSLWIWVLVALYQQTGEERYKEWALDTIAYLDRDMSHPEGAFYSAEDADSEGEEGKFYVWEYEEISKILGDKSREFLFRYWNVTLKGNFEHGTNILNVTRGLSALANEFGMTEDDAKRQLAEAREKLLAVRSERIRPLLDDKVLTSWNALAISAYARAGRAFGDADLIARAEKAMAFIRQNLVTADGRLLRRWRDGEAKISGFLVDHAQLGVAALDLFEATSKADYFAYAKHLAAEITRLFKRPEGAFFDTGEDQEALVVRTMEGYDGVEPSGNSAASQLFLRLYGFTGEKDHLQGALEVLETFREGIEKMPISHSAMLETLHRLVRGQKEVLLSGPENSEDVKSAKAILDGGFFPEICFAQSHPGNHQALLDAGLHLAEGREPGEAMRVFICKEQACQLPITTVEELREAVGWRR